MQIGTLNQIKSLLNIADVLSFYGQQPDRHGKYICLVHNDTHPSASIDKKHNRLKCFSCGASLSVIDLPMIIFNISNTEAAERLNKDFELHLDLSKPPKASDVARISREKELSGKFDEWEMNAWWTLNAWYRALAFMKKTFKPKDPN